MTNSPILLPTLNSTFADAIFHLSQKHNTSLVAPPGCGTSTLLPRIKEELKSKHFNYIDIDFQRISVSEAIKLIKDSNVVSESGKEQVVIIDHSSCLLQDDFSRWIDCCKKCLTNGIYSYFWVGSLDSRAISNQYSYLIHSVPKSHITFPLLARDELLSVYNSIAESNHCRWGEAIKYLLLDLCGNDLSLVTSLAEYLYGDWLSKLYDASIWDRIEQWLSNDPLVNQYRDKFRFLSEDCKHYLYLIYLGGKPTCTRAALHEEVDDALRDLCLQGFLVQNLLPGYYQLRNLTVRHIINEKLTPAASCSVKTLFRKATNERIALIIQDVEFMLRSLLYSVFSSLGEESVTSLLKKKQGDREFMSKNVHRDIHELLGNIEDVGLCNSFNSILNDNRKRFKELNSVWNRVTQMIETREEYSNTPMMPTYLNCIEYLTFAELGDILMDLLDKALPKIGKDGTIKRNIENNWREGISRVNRLRNRVAHLRNVDFQDMEDLIGTVENMRKDIIKKGGIHLTQVPTTCSVAWYESTTESSGRRGLPAYLPGVPGMVCR